MIGPIAEFQYGGAGGRAMRESAPRMGQNPEHSRPEMGPRIAPPLPAWPGPIPVAALDRAIPRRIFCCRCKPEKAGGSAPLASACCRSSGICGAEDRARQATAAAGSREASAMKPFMRQLDQSRVEIRIIARNSEKCIEVHQ
jgi:hypothetical protein